MKNIAKKVTYSTFGWLSVISALVLLIPRIALGQEENFPGVVFDPKNEIKEATNLPSASPPSIVINVMQWVLGFLGLISVIMIIWGGFTWMTAAGNEEKIKKAKEVLKAAIIGLIVILLSYSIVAFIFSQSDEFTTPKPTP